MSKRPLTGHLVTDEQIEASVREAEAMLGKLQLTEGEREWARRQAKETFNAITDKFFEDCDDFKRLRAVSVTAALAAAMVWTRDWAAQADALKDKI